ncbi:MAG: flippase [Clostridiaceae bacterium]|jgi:O-antigen/teichoic acid export membrane protein|nr:flippase [Clostridiaceae bacterium]
MRNYSNNQIGITSIKKNFIMNLILKLSSFIFPFITFPYVSRVLQPVGNGKIAFTSSIIYYFCTFAMLGLPTYGIRICSKYRDDKFKLSQTVQELIIINSITVVISYIAFALSIIYIEVLQNESILLIINSFSILLGAIGVEWLYQALEQYTYITIRNLAFKVVSILLMFLLVKDTQDYIFYGAINVFANTGSNILNIINIKKFITFKPTGNYNFRQHIKPIMMLFALSVSISIYTSLDTTMLGFVSGNKEVGYYNVAIKIKTILISLVTALGTVLLPRVSYYAQNGMIKEFKNTISKSINFTILISVPIVFYFVITAESMIYFLAGIAYQGAIIPMQIITPTVFLIGMSNIMGIQILIPLGKEKLIMISTIIGAIVNFTLNLFLIPQWGATGAAVATLLAEIAVSAIQFIFVHEIIISTSIIKSIRSIFIALVVSSGVLLGCVQLNLKLYFWYLLFTSLCFFGTYVIALIATHEKFTIEILQACSIKIYKKGLHIKKNNIN